MLRVLFAVFLLLPLPSYANENNTETTTTTIPGEVEEVETFDGSDTEPEQTTDIELPEDELDISGNEVENNIQIDDEHSNGDWFCCGMTDFHMNLHYQQHGNDSNDYTFTLPETTTVDEEELQIEIYEVGFRIGALNNDGTVQYTHTDETTQTNTLEGQDNSNVQTMYEDVVYNIYNTLDTFIKSFTITINDWSLLDDISFKYITPTTTTTTLPPPPPPEPAPEEIIVDIKVKGVDKTYTQADVNDGTIDRDKERVANQDKYGCYMTDAQIERGDCDIVEEDEKPNTETELPDDDVVVLEVVVEDEVKEPEPIKEEDIVEEEIKIDVKELEEEFKFEEEEIIFEDIPEDIVIVIEEEIVEEVEEVAEEVLVEPIQEDVKEEPTKVVEEPVEVVVEELTEEQVAEEVAEVEEVIKDIVIEEVTTEEVIEVIEQVNDIGVQNLDQATEEVQEVVQSVVEEAIENVEELTEEQVEVVAEVLQVQKEDVEIIAEAVKEDEVVAEAVQEYVQRAVENADVENYTLADVVTEVQYENFLENPIETFVDLDFEGITISNIGDDMTQDQKEKAQEVVVPVILTRIATMAAFVFRRSL